MKRIIKEYNKGASSIEYSIINEGGNPILIMHGGHSNCNEEFGYAELVEQGYSIGISAGGPSAIYFTSRFRDFPPFTGEIYMALLQSMFHILPKFTFKQMAPTFSKGPYAKFRSQISDGDIPKLKDMIGRQRSGHGFLIDFSQTSHFNLTDLPMIKCRHLFFIAQMTGLFQSIMHIMLITIFRILNCVFLIHGDI